MKFQAGQKVILNGPIYQSANGTLTKGTAENKLCIIRKVAENAAHPYMIEGTYGWFNEDEFSEYKPIPVEINDFVKILKPITYSGQKFVKRYDVYVVRELIGDKATVSHNGVQTVVVNAYNLEKVK